MGVAIGFRDWGRGSGFKNGIVFRFQNKGGAGFWDRGLGRVSRRGQGRGLFRDKVEVRVGFRDRDRGSWLGFGMRSGSSFEKEDRGRGQGRISGSRSCFGTRVGVGVGF